MRNPIHSFSPTSYSRSSSFPSRHRSAALGIPGRSENLELGGVGPNPSHLTTWRETSATHFSTVRLQTWTSRAVRWVFCLAVKLGGYLADDGYLETAGCDLVVVCTVTPRNYATFGTSLGNHFVDGASLVAFAVTSKYHPKHCLVIRVFRCVETLTFSRAQAASRV